MLKCLAIIVLAFTTVGFLAGQTAPLSSQEKGINARDAPTAIGASAPANDDAGQQGRENLKIQRELAWFTFLLVVVGFLQVGTMIWQALLLRETRKQIQTQAKHMETSERAWIVAIPENAQIPPSVDNPSGSVWCGCAVRYVNTGKTPAFVFEIGYRAVVQDMKQPLPDVQPVYEERRTVGKPKREISKWDGDGFPVQPGAHVFESWIGNWGSSAKRIRTGYDFFWVYGYVKYRDIFGHDRETWYCYRWNPGIGTDNLPTFTADGPKGYNRVT